MFVLYCAVCDRRTLLGVDEVDWVENLTRGVISVSGHCPLGHDAAILTGDAFTPHADPRYFGPAPRVWTKPVHRLRGWLRTRFEMSRDLPGPFYRF
ncbi:hypothetical protein G3I59_14865 [Amycolatopsis rubida]|uniref:Uncharacterized protein n=1 Tax=Amycolatopsis rubida TaxID=112413 RepID=A0A1I5FCM9_9PSEU|nr:MULTISPECIES: hypothetical protein [Amycolatopsis]MYW91844.1 hypothetical protein [Amycolatopsis rubida]NEC56829.1 hypothetical protein [Amycolatopsis rubida]OAP28004.1 hypothetical protein A4R44_01614 [Amycolatopsis sp. M39]SFO21497.1 hypothetical protein SAMN05421854_1011055 [Amycolatopsis rubida]